MSQCTEALWRVFQKKFHKQIGRTRHASALRFVWKDRSKGRVKIYIVKMVKTEMARDPPNFVKLKILLDSLKLTSRLMHGGFDHFIFEKVFFSHFKIYLMVSRYDTLMRGPESIKYMHMIHCICLNRAQQWPTAVCLLFSAASQGRVRNLGLVSKIETFLGPNWNFGPIWDQVPNLGPFWSAWIIHS